MWSLLLFTALMGFSVHLFKYTKPETLRQTLAKKKHVVTDKKLSLAPSDLVMMPLLLLSLYVLWQLPVSSVNDVKAFISVLLGSYEGVYHF